MEKEESCGEQTVNTTEQVQLMQLCNAHQRAGTHRKDLACDLGQRASRAGKE